jgi:hypothetical protein
MILFLTPIGHPDTSKNYSKVMELLQLTTNSISNQSDRDFKFVIVCNEVPNIKHDDPNVIYHIVDFEPPKFDRNMPITQANKDYRVFMRDKGTRLLSGLLHSLQYEPDYVFLLDCDDWININVTQFLNSQNEFPVWFVDKGYVLNYKTKKYKRKSGMIRYCGSTLAYKTDFLMKLADLKLKVDGSTDQATLLESTSSMFIEDILGNHARGYYYFRDMGIEPTPLPFRAVTWVVESGENVSRSTGGEHGITIKEDYCKEFGNPLFLNKQKPSSLTAIVREFVGNLKSRLSWYKSTKSDHFFY